MERHQNCFLVFNWEISSSVERRRFTERLKQKITHRFFKCVSVEVEGRGEERKGKGDLIRKIINNYLF